MIVGFPAKVGSCHLSAFFVSLKLFILTLFTGYLSLGYNKAMRFLNQKQIGIFNKKDKKIFRTNRIPSLSVRLIIIVLIIIFFFVLNLSPVSGQMKDFFYSISEPVQAWFWKEGSVMSDFFETISEAKRFKEENERFELQNQELIIKDIEIEQLRKENEVLRTALNLDLKQEFDLKISQVIGKDISEDFLIIDKGSGDRLSLGFPVITQQKSLVGKITEVYDNVSKVQLLTSKNSSFDVEIFEKEIYGLAKGNNNLKLLLDLIPWEEEVKIGDKVITSVLGGNFPQGLLVGEIKDIRKSDIKSFQEAEIKPGFEIRELDYVFIITNFKF